MSQVQVAAQNLRPSLATGGEERQQRDGGGEETHNVMRGGKKTLRS